MKRFLILNFNDNFNSLVKDLIKDWDYVINPHTDGDNDVVIIDTLNKCWTYGENGSLIVSNGFLDDYQYEETIILETIIEDSFNFSGYGYIDDEFDL